MGKKQPLLTILCVTAGSRKGRNGLLSHGKLKKELIENGIETEYHIAIDRSQYYGSYSEIQETKKMATQEHIWNNDRMSVVATGGKIENVLGYLLEEEIKTEWVLRLDDDEAVSEGMMKLLPSLILPNMGRKHRGFIYKFPRGNVWIAGGSRPKTYVLRSPPLWPDYQVRLFRKEHFDWPEKIHAPHKTSSEARTARGLIWHYKFILRDYEERQRQAHLYEKHTKGAGLSKTYMPFTLPEDYFKTGCQAVHVPEGTDPATDFQNHRPEDWKKNAPTIRLSNKSLSRTELLEF